jgi:hypothetical protein
MATCKYLLCEQRSETIFCADHTPAIRPVVQKPPLTEPPILSTHAERGSKGGKARATNLSPERRKEIARAAVKARWAKK